jgi:hypothetical protein
VCRATSEDLHDAYPIEDVGEDEGGRQASAAAGRECMSHRGGDCRVLVLTVAEEGREKHKKYRMEE